MDMIVCNTFFQKRDSRLITYSSGGNQSQIDYILTKKDDRKRISDVKVIPGEECALQHKLLVADMNICKPKVQRKNLLQRGRSGS